MVNLLHLLILAFSASVLLADDVIAKEFCWQVQQRSVLGVVIIMCGT